MSNKRKRQQKIEEKLKHIETEIREVFDITTNEEELKSASARLDSIHGLAYGLERERRCYFTQEEIEQEYFLYGGNPEEYEDYEEE